MNKIKEFVTKNKLYVGIGAAVTVLVLAVIIVLLSGGSDKDEQADTTTTSETVETTTVVPETTTEEPTTEAPTESTTVKETTTTAPETTTEEQTTTVPETTTKAQETTTKKPETTTKKQTTTKKPETTTKAPETTTKAPEPTTSSRYVEPEVREKILNLHIADYPDEARETYLKFVEGVGYEAYFGPNYRVAADYVDDPASFTDCGGTDCYPTCRKWHDPNPYTMYELTTRKYWGDRDEETIGFYSVYSSNVYWDIMQKYTQDIQAVLGLELEPYHEIVKVGSYDREEIVFIYFFVNNPEDLNLN